MTKLLIAIKSSRPDYRKGVHDAIRSGWGSEFRGLADVRFFVGKGEDARDHVNLRSDETLLGCDDGAMAQTWKTRDICQWAVGKLYSHIFFVDKTAIVSDAKAVLASGFENYDYQGSFNRDPFGGPFDYADIDPKGMPHHYQQCYAWASGSRGYFLSRPAFEAVSAKYPNQNEWAEDMWVGQIIMSGAEVGDFRVNDYGK
jgi:hypothetical protein